MLKNVHRWMFGRSTTWTTLPAVWEPTGANLRTRLSVCPRSGWRARVSPSDNYSSNMELAIEALIRMKMSQLASYQSISGESRFKQDIKDGRTVSSLFPLSAPHVWRQRTGLWNPYLCATRLKVSWINKKINVWGKHVRPARCEYVEDEHAVKPDALEPRGQQQQHR